VLAEIDHRALAGESPHPFLLGVPQSTTEAVLTNRLEARGIEVERGVTLVGCRQDPEGVTSTLRHSDGRTEVVRSRWVAACDGPDSSVRDTLGIPCRGDDYPTSYAVGDVELEWDEQPDRAVLVLGDRGSLLLHPVGEERWRIAVDCGPMRNRSRPAPPTRDLLQRVCDEQLFHPARVRAVHWSTFHAVHHRSATRLRDGRVFLLGDAAQAHSPLTFQGMNAGIEDAWNLGWKLACAERAVAGEALLDSYDAERRGVDVRNISDHAEIERLFDVRSPIARRARDAVFPFLASTPGYERAMARRTTDAAYAYRSSPAVGGGVHDHPRPGDLAPEDPARTGGGVAILDGRSYVSLLFMRSETDLDAFRTPVWPTDGSLRVRTVVVSRSRPDARTVAGTASVDDSSGALHRAWSPSRPTQVLVRPDGHIGWRGRPGDAEGLANHLADVHGVRVRGTVPAAEVAARRAG
jgi:2-polyprenyl-6-methoxyphenol hydroxylase-like FAD-dependent oxidoreductase